MENKDRFGKILLLTLILVLGFVAYKRTSEAPTATVSVDQDTKAESLLAKEDVEQIVKEFIMKNPNILIESIEKMHKKKVDEMNAKTAMMIKSKKAELEEDKNSPTLGNGPVNVVMIYDYACSYCKKASMIVDKLLSDNDQVRVIYKPYPILGDSSEYMTKVAMSVYKLYPDKFRIIHHAMISRKIASREDVVKILEENNLPVITIESEFENQDIKTSLANLTAFAHKLKIQGVPVFIIDDNLHPGFLELSRIKEIIEPLLPLKKDDEDEEETTVLAEPAPAPASNAPKEAQPTKDPVAEEVKAAPSIELAPKAKEAAKVVEEKAKIAPIGADAPKSEGKTASTPSSAAEPKVAPYEAPPAAKAPAANKLLKELPKPKAPKHPPVRKVAN